MRVSHLELKNFRNHNNSDFDFSGGVTTIIGRNGRGKTNIVEAINYIAILGSHRVAQDAPLIQHGFEDANIIADVEKQNRTAHVEITISSGRQNVVELNRAPLRRPRDVLGLVRTVIFAPEDLELVKGDPSARRKYLDDFSVLMLPRFAGVRSDYEKTLRQRNTLLKSAGRRALSETARATLQAWDEQLVTHGTTIVKHRLDAIRKLQPLIAIHGDTLSNSREPMESKYVSSWCPQEATTEEEIAEAFRQALELRHHDEVERGITLVGPHRDDLELQLSGLPAKGYASHGQTWSFCLAMRLASFDVLRTLDDDPILILDDVFAELDQARRTRLLQAITSVEQTIVTAAVAEDVPTGLVGNTIYLEDV